MPWPAVPTCQINHRQVHKLKSMASRLLVTAACLLVLLLLALGAALSDACTGAAHAPAHRKVAPGSKVSTSKKEPAESSAEFNVDGYGAVGDGHRDDTKAFQKAWAKACSSPQPAVLLVPTGKKYLVKEIAVSGPCKSPVTFKLEGSLVASPNKSDWSTQTLSHWVRFSNADSLTVTGKGIMDGNGKAWWQKSCRINPRLPCTVAPTALTFSSCNHLKVEDIKLVNSPQIHLWIENCHDVTLSHLTITAPGDSPETDGIHISRSDGVRIIKAAIKTGDDCISIETGTKNVHASSIECGPGHGISIGSLGDNNSEAQVSNITVDTAHLSGTKFGARIKSWQGGRGYAKDIKFLNVVMDNVKNPIIVDQNYCTMADPSKPKPCEQQSSAVQFSNVMFRNIRGTTATKDAIKLHCSSAFPCRGIVLQDIELKLKGSGGDKNVATSSCQNAKLSKSSNVSPSPCTSKVPKDDWVAEA